MTPAIARHPFVKATAALACALAMAGCAVDPSANHAGRAESDKSRFAGHEKVDVDADARSDFDKAMKHLREGEYEKGATLLIRVTERAPDHAVPYINLAIAYRRMDKLPAAEESIRKALAIDPENPVANTEHGLIARKTGKFADARAAYERALARHPDFLPARKNLGILCDLFLRDLECALANYRQYSASAPEDQTVRIWIADVEQRLRRKAP